VPGDLGHRLTHQVMADNGVTLVGRQPVQGFAHLEQ
jgi:hypothetical protein